ncbi:hypothetical protein SDC9_184908 [bioreactor metagenome]|uniref:Uncharacterized protein n=1 Tax=bioreactor metagenome TaxID=1076179 RepID=A0A645HEF2_9ZZZZ
MIDTVQRRMGQYCNTVGTVNQANGLLHSYLGLGNPRWPMFLQKTLEGLIQARADPSLNQGTCHVRPSRCPAIGDLKDGFRFQRHLPLIQQGHNSANPILAHLLKPSHLG